jgi:iron complex transport system substrate-binding protein
VGAGQKVVEVTNYCNYPTDIEEQIEANELTRLGGYWNPLMDTIVGLKPDLVLASTAKYRVETNECKVKCKCRCELLAQATAQLRSLGLKVLTLGPHSMIDVIDNILLVGKASGNTAEVINLVERLRQRIEIVVKKSKAATNRPRVYFEVWNDPYVSVSKGTWIGDTVNLAGGTNIFGDAVSEWPILNPEISFNLALT